MKGKLLIILISMLTMSVAYGQSNYEKYIDKYSSIAVSEMYRSGIPASITLAQGLLESGCGRSELALKSNNHFGIKCHNGWKGGRVYHDDDEKGECFRKYDHPEDSYKDHSDFLRYRDRYKFLFDYKVTDYKAWAYGLKKAGYATDPAYPKKLISLIEEYKLYEYDTKSKPRSESRHSGKASKTSEPQQQTLPESPTQIEQVKQLTGEKRESFSFSLSRQLYSQNGVPFVYSVEGETYKSIAASNNLFLRELLKFNDVKSDEELRPGTIVYLQKKKKQGLKGLDMHVMEKGETLRGVAQRYGVRLDALRKINSITSDDVVREGDIIRLRK